MLQNQPLVAKVGFDEAENRPRRGLRNRSISSNDPSVTQNQIHRRITRLHVCIDLLFKDPFRGLCSAVSTQRLSSAECQIAFLSSEVLQGAIGAVTESADARLTSICDALQPPATKSTICQNSKLDNPAAASKPRILAPPAILESFTSVCHASMPSSVILWHPYIDRTSTDMFHRACLVLDEFKTVRALTHPLLHRRSVFPRA